MFVGYKINYLNLKLFNNYKLNKKEKKKKPKKQKTSNTFNLRICENYEMHY